MDNQNCLEETLVSFGLKVKNAVVEAKDEIVISGCFCGEIFFDRKGDNQRRRPCDRSNFL